MKLRISVSSANEVNPKELSKLFLHGAQLIKSECSIGVYVGGFDTIHGKHVVAYSDDDICINNVILPLSIDATYDNEIEINVPD